MTKQSRRSSQPVESAAKDQPSKTSLFHVCILAALIAVLGMLGLIVWNQRQTPEPVVEQLAPSVTPRQMPPASAPPVDRASTVMLSDIPVPVNSEALQREAESVAEQLAARYPRVAPALHVAAMAWSQLRQSQQAEQLWTRCIELEPENEHYPVNLAAVLIDRGQSDTAVSVLEQAQSRGHDSPELLYHLTIAQTNLGNFDSAEQIAGQALEAFSNNAEQWFALGQAQLKNQKYGQAESSLLKARELGVESARLYFALGTACARQGKRDEATKFLDVYKQLSTSRDLDKHERFAILSTEDAQRTALAVLTEASIVHANQRDTLEAERLLLRAIAIHPHGLAANRALADLYRDASMLAEERVVRMRMTELAPGNAQNFIALADVCSRMNDAAAVEAVLKRACSVSPREATPFALLADFYLTTGRPDRSRWYAQESVRRRPTAEAYRLLAAACKAMGADEHAEQAFAKAKQIEANHPGGDDNGALHQ